MYDMIPDELKKLEQWCCWQSEPDDSRPGKIKKMPVNARTGGLAQSNNPSTWCDFETALQSSENYTGLGFMFANGYFGVDIDGVGDDIEKYQRGDQENIIAEFIHTLQSYAEYSVSGKGIHIICRGNLPPQGRRRENVEMYQSGRFFVVTGKCCAEYKTIRDCTETIKPLHEKYIGGGSIPTTGIKVLPLNLSESEIIKLAEQSKQGALFADLYAGNYSGYYRSQSEADMALCNILAFWCRKDEQLMDKIFRQSGLMREKWDRKTNGTTYGAATIAKAARECGAVYEPKPEYGVSVGTTKPEKKRYKPYTFDDTGNAQRFVDTFGESVLYNYTAKKWMYFDGRRWCDDDTGEVKRMVDEIVDEMRGELEQYLENLPPEMDPEEAEQQFLRHVKASRSSKYKTAMLKEAEHRAPIKQENLDTRKSLFNTTNGIINLATGELLPHDRTRLISKIAHAEYTDKIDFPLWERFLDDIFSGDKDLIRYIQKAVGYSMTGSTQEQCAFFLYGTGSNGKSTFLDIISEIMGDYAVNIQPETLMVRQNNGGPTSDIARLKGARFVTTVEPNEGARLNEGLLKQLTGGDRVTASKKYENEFEFMPEFKLWMGTNHKPVIRGTDLGIWRRIRLIPFTVQIPDSKVDKRLKHKLRQEMSGILKWAVDGCLLWQREGLCSPSVVDEASKEYKGEMDVLSSFLDECTERGGDVNAGELFRAYSQWAKDSNEYEMSSTKFGREMSKRFERRKYNVAIYVGLHLLDEKRPLSLWGKK